MSCSDYGSDELIFDYESDFEPSWIAIDESNKDNEKNYVNGIVPPYPIPALQSPKKKQIEESIPIDSTEVDWFWACPRCTYWCESTKEQCFVCEYKKDAGISLFPVEKQDKKVNYEHKESHTDEISASPIPNLDTRANYLEKQECKKTNQKENNQQVEKEVDIEDREELITKMIEEHIADNAEQFLEFLGEKKFGCKMCCREFSTMNIAVVHVRLNHSEIINQETIANAKRLNMDQKTDELLAIQLSMFSESVSSENTDWGTIWQEIGLHHEVSCNDPKDFVDRHRSLLNLGTRVTNGKKRRKVSRIARNRQSEIEIELQELMSELERDNPQITKLQHNSSHRITRLKSGAVSEKINYRLENSSGIDSEDELIKEKQPAKKKCAILNTTKQRRLEQLLQDTEKCLIELQNDLSAVSQASSSLGSEDIHDNALIATQPQMMVFGELKDYQLQGLSWLLCLRSRGLNGILADDMGLGKTIQTLALLAKVWENESDRGPHLIVAPLSTLGGWERAINEWTPNLQCFVHRGVKEERYSHFETKMLCDNPCPILITSYDLIMRDTALFNRMEWKYLIVDEGHRLKKHGGKLVVALNQLHVRNKLLLTGTPLQNSLDELWSLLHFILPNVFASKDRFCEWFSSPFDLDCASMTEEERLIIVERLHQVLRPFLLRRVKSQVSLDLPQKIERFISCPMSPYQRALYNSLQNGVQLRVDPATGERTCGGFSNILVQLRKVSNHPYLLLQEYDIDEYMIRASGKLMILNAILCRLHSTNHRVLIFSQMTCCLDLIEYYCEMAEWMYLRLDGNTKSEQRERDMEEFNREGSKVFLYLISTRAGGVGLNLQSADTVILFDGDWNPHVDLQAQDRVYRLGQQSDVLILRLISSGSIECEVQRRAQRKLQTEAAVIGAGQFTTDWWSRQDRKELLQAALTNREDSSQDSKIVDTLPTQNELDQLVARNEKDMSILSISISDRFQQGLMQGLWDCGLLTVEELVAKRKNDNDRDSA